MTDYWNDANALKGDLHRAEARANAAEESALIAIARAEKAECELADVLRTLGSVYLAAVRRGA